MTIRGQTARSVFVLVVLFLATAPSFSDPAVLRAQATAAQTAPNAADAEEQAHGHFRLGTAYFENGDFVSAAREFEQAYALTARPELLYNIYVSHRDAGAVRPAADALRRYLEFVPNAENAVQLRSRLRAMERTLAEQAPTPPPTEPTTVSPTTEPQTEAQPDTSVAHEPTEAATQTSTASSTTAPSRTDVPASGGGVSAIGIGVAAIGGVAIIAGVLTGVFALDAQSQLERLCGTDHTCPPGMFETTRESGSTLALATDILLIGGGVVAATGIVLMLALPTGESGSTTRANLTCSGTGCGLRVTGEF